MNHKRYRPAKSRGAGALCECNPHQKALGNRDYPIAVLRANDSMAEQIADSDEIRLGWFATHEPFAGAE